MESEKGHDTDWDFVRCCNSKCCAHTAAREVGANHARHPAWENCRKSMKIDRRDPKMRFPAA